MAPSRDPFTGGEPLPQLVYERLPGAASQPLPSRRYQPSRHPENTPLYRAVYHGLQDFLEEATLSGTAYPSFIEKELRKFLGCKILGRGFARVVCPSCKQEHLLAFSCKSRVCPSCWSRRAADFAATTVGQVLPEVPYRQLVISFPWAMRLALAFQPTFLTEVFRCFVRSVLSWFRLRARRRGIRDGTPGAILLIQRHGSAINLNPHGHLVVTDGLFVPAQRGQILSFEPLPPPTHEELHALLERVIERTLALNQKRFGEDEFCLDPDEQLLAQAMAEALRAPIASPSFAHLAPAPAPDEPQPRDELCLQRDGFSMHAARQLQAHDREGLEKLLRYGARAPVAASRLSIDERGRVVYELTKPWGVTRATVLRLSPSDFLRRMAMLIPPPYQNLIRHYGAFASRSKLRPLLPPPPAAPLEPPNPAASQDDLDTDGRDDDLDDDLAQDQDAAPPPPQRAYRLPWAQLMKRVLGLDPLTCKRCATPMVILAFISNLDVVRKILDHLKIPTDVVPAPLAHGPWHSQTLLDVTEPETEGDRTAAAAARGAQLDTSLGKARGPPSC